MVRRSALNLEPWNHELWNPSSLRLGSRVSSRGSSDGHVIEDPVAAVALDDFLALEHVVEHLRPEPHVTDRADAKTRLGDRDALAAAGNQLELREHLRRERFHDVGAFARKL